MNATRSGFRRIAATAALAAVLAAGAAAGDARDAYRDGQNALVDGRFADAESLFRQAIAERAEAKVGTFRRDYLPYYYLGRALEGQGRCREALDAWTEAERQGQVLKSAEDATDLAARQQRCQDRIRALDAARTAAEQAVARARKAEQTLSRLAETPDLAALWSDGDPSFAAREQAARERLAGAARLLEPAAGEDPAPFQEAKLQANQAAGELDQVTADAQARLAEIRDAASSALGRLEAAEFRARSELRQVAFLEPFPPEVGRRAAALRRALDDTVAKKATAAPAQLDRLGRALRDAAASLRQAAQGPPESLRNAVEAYLGGRYEEVLATLDGESFRDPRAAAEACLLRSAARYALYVLGSEQDAEMGAALHREVLACRELKPASQIDAKFFSPRFIAFYESLPALDEETEQSGGEGEDAESLGTERPE